MAELLDYETRAPRRPSRRRWNGVMTVAAVGSGFVAWGKAASARGGPLPGELGVATMLVLGSLVLSVIVLTRVRPLRALAGPAAILAMGIAVAVLFSGFATWHLFHCRW